MNRTESIPLGAAPDSLRMAGAAGGMALRGVGRTLIRKPGASLAVVGGGCLAAAIFANALLLQPERHPYPIFANPAARSPQRTVPLPTPRVNEKDIRLAALNSDVRMELAKRGFYVEPTQGSSGTTLEAAIRDYQEAAGIRIDGLPSEGLLVHIRGSNLTVKDQILQMLKPGQSGIDVQARILMTQKALNKLGYGPLREDGLTGPSTKTAIERFERDRKLPVRGEPEGRTLKELSQASGMAVE